ncbi:MAG: fibronectin type III domain-containing protein, partial [Paramuribaculum sp.]|nr:fibronectin type III domain-containing protein [Paramuribaculum sp.]
MKYIKLYHTISLSAILALTPVALTSCDDDTDPTPIASTSQLTSGAVTYNSLSFTWEPVDNAVQYGCQLTDANGEAVDAKVTKSTSVTFTGLEAATTYTLNVWAYAAVGGPYATSEPVTITATTTALSQLAAPHVAIDNRAGTVTASWNAVEGATSYQVTLALDGETLSSSEETGTSYSWSGLEKGNYIVTV